MKEAMNAFLDWCEKYPGEMLYAQRNDENTEVTIYAGDGVLTIPVELWELFVVIMAEHRPDVKLDPTI